MVQKYEKCVKFVTLRASMKVVAILGYPSDEKSAEFERLRSGIVSCGHSFQLLGGEQAVPADASMLLCLGGDGTFLRGARLAAKADIPILGVNFGRLGFLSENSVDSTVEAFRSGKFNTKERHMLQAQTPCGEYVALNEIAVRRSGPAMLGVVVGIGGKELPTYWGDGLVVASAAGSTGYNLSVGGPIVFPSSQVHIIAPIAPHNLNVRPLVIPNDREITLRFVSRDDQVCVSADNQSFTVSKDAVIRISMAQFSLKRLCLEDTSFVKALIDKLSWGEDKRNER